jgi:hypothetical protein
VITEYGFSAFSGEAEVTLPGALFDADMIARYLSAGGSAAYLLGYGPGQLYQPEQECAGYGELMLFGEDGQGQATWPTPAYWAMRLLTHEWLVHGDGVHKLYRASLDRLPTAERRYLTAWPVLRPDGRWSVMLINRSPTEAFSIRLAFEGAGKASRTFQGAWDGVQYGRSDFRWQPNGSSGHPLLDQPPHPISGNGGEILLPPYSITVAHLTEDRN